MPVFFRQKLLKVLAFCLVFYAVERFCHKQTDGFALINIKSDLSYHEEWALPSPTGLEKKELETIFKIPFSYLCKGGQAYVFISQDNQYVLKFFKHQHRRIPYILSAIPLPHSLELFRERKIQSKKQALEQEFASYKLSYESLKTESGLIFVHLNKGDLDLTATIVDKLGITHSLDLNEYEFILQKRAVGALEKIKALKPDEARCAVRDLVGLFGQMAEKGICNEDPNLSKNFGFIDSTPIQIDIGRCVKGKLNTQEIARKNGEFKDQLFQYNIELRDYFEDELTILKDHNLQN